MGDPGDAYASAGQHYTSPARRDWVKRAWEEPALVRHLDAALRRAHALGMRGRLDVLDVGCGTGVALDALLTSPALTDGTLTLDRATGLDLDEGLLTIARRRFADDRRIGFVHGDLTDPPPTGPHDLVLSSGVPFSHLEPEALPDAVARLATVALGGPEGPGLRVVLLVVDVLGRHSIEWTSRWDEARWDYRMSFFSVEGEVPTTPMTTWSGTGLRAAIRRAAGTAGASVADLVLVDRSIAVGRHTMTGEYTPDLPHLRELVDALAAADAPVATSVDPAALRLRIALPPAPADVRDFHLRFAEDWNAVIDRAVEEGTDGPTLAERLRALEAGAEPAGLGVGHSLTAFAVLTR